MPAEYEDFAFNAISLTNPARDDSALAETLTGDNEYSESADEDQHTHSVALEIPVPVGVYFDCRRLWTS